MTTITIKESTASIVTDIDTAKKLVQKNSSCSSTIKGKEVTLVYEMDELNTLSSLIKSYKI